MNKEIQMQFGLRTLLVGLTVVAFFCGLFFATPLVIELPVLSMIVLIAPSVWICGACFAKGAWRPFFLGGICAGWLPHVFLMYFGGMSAAAYIGGNSSGFIVSIDETDEWSMVGRFSIAVFFLFPGFVAFLGAMCGVLVHRWCGAGTAGKPATVESSKLRDAYVVLESRLTPVSPEPVMPETAAHE